MWLQLVQIVWKDNIESAELLLTVWIQLTQID